MNLNTVLIEKEVCVGDFSAVGIILFTIFLG